jgi:DNA-binding IclR family transcriptional regulator
MAGILEKGLAILEHLAAAPHGDSLANIATAANMPRSGAHRLLTDLCRRGYVSHLHKHGDYALSIKMASIGLRFLSASGIVDTAQPVLDDLAKTSGELARLSVVDSGRLIWVAKAQGARRGLRYDPDMGKEAKLSCTASGHAWLLTMTDDEALELAARQGFGKPSEFGPKAPTSASALIKYIHMARARGYSMIDEVFTPGMSAMAAPIRNRDRICVGVVSVAGPRVRLDRKRMTQLGPSLLDAAAELGVSIGASTLFSNRPWEARA